MLSNVENTLRHLGFTVSEHCGIRPSCFDFAARRKKLLILIKTSENLGAIPQEYGLELRLIAQKLSAAPILVGLPTSKNRIENGTAYSRHGIHAVTLETLLDAFENREYPLVEARPGGFYVQLDKVAIQARRRELGLSLGELASMIGVSRRTVYGYERGLAKATVSTALKLETILGAPIAHHINIFMPRKQGDNEVPKQLIKNKFLHKVLRKINSLGLMANVTRKAPFDFIIPGDGNKIIGGAINREEKLKEHRMRITASIAKVTKSKPIFIVEERVAIDKSQMVNWNELKKFKAMKDLLEICS